MAEAESEVFLTDLIHCKEEIVRRLEEIERRVSERKQILLAEIARIQERYEKTLEARRAVQKLEKSRETIIKSVGDLFTKNTTQQGILKQLDDEINGWKLSLEVFENVSVSFNGENEVLSCIARLGQIRYEGGADYELRTKPSLFLKPSQKVGFESLCGVSVDTNGNIYSTDRKRIIIFSSDTTEVRYIEDQHLKSPFGICVRNDSIFVTDINTNQLSKFKCDGTSQKQVGSKGSKDTEFNQPSGLDIDSDNLIYICDLYNNRISIYDTDLQWKKIVKHNDLTLPHDIKIRDNLFILYQWHCLCILSKSGELINKLPNIADNVKSAFWFCLDKTGNILISDRDGGVIKIFTPTGMLKHTLGSDLQDNGLSYCHRPRGIAVSPDGKIVSVSSDKNPSLKIFNFLSNFTQVYCVYSILSCLMSYDILELI